MTSLIKVVIHRFPYKYYYYFQQRTVAF